MIAYYAQTPDYQNIRPALNRILEPQLAEHGGVKDKKILIKPNLLAWRKNPDIACVHPSVILETARFFHDAGAAEIAILETPAVQSVSSILHAMGIAEELKKINVKYANFTRYEKVPAQDGFCFHNIEIAAEYRDYDFTVDLAKAKTHAMMLLTLCVKNLFGLVQGSARLGWHLSVGRNFDSFADMLLDLYLCVKPSFNIIDGIVCMEGNGPGSGTPAVRGFLAGGTDSLALDASVAEILGMNPEKLYVLRRAQKRGIPFAYENCGEVPAIRPLLLPDPPGPSLEWGVWLPLPIRGFLKKKMLSHPLLDPSKCVGCGVCAKMCPPQSLKIINHRPVFNLPECIRCYCCQEHCPKGAITPEKSRMMRFVEKLEHFLRK